MSPELVELKTELESLRRKLSDQEENHRRQIDALQEEIKFWKDKLFGRRSEKADEFERTEMLLFDEAEDGAVGVLSAEQQASYRIPVRGHRRRLQGVRKPLPANLPRVVVVHDIPEEQKVCGCGARLVKIDELPHGNWNISRRSCTSSGT